MNGGRVGVAGARDDARFLQRAERGQAVGQLGRERDLGDRFFVLQDRSEIFCGRMCEARGPVGASFFRIEKGTLDVDAEQGGAFEFVRQPGEAQARSLFFLSIIYLPLLFAVMVFDRA